MKLLKRLMFAFRYDIDYDFVVVTPNKNESVRFMSYRDALYWSRRIYPEYDLKVFVSVLRPTKTKSPSKESEE